MPFAVYEDPIRTQKPLAFESGMKMKIVVADKTASLLFLTATVSEVKDHQLRVSIDGKPDHRSYWLRIPTSEPSALWRRAESSRWACVTSSAPPPPDPARPSTSSASARPLITPATARPITPPASSLPPPAPSTPLTSPASPLTPPWSLTLLPPVGPLTPPATVAHHASDKLLKHLESLALPYKPNLWTQSDVSALVTRVAGPSAGTAVAAARMSGPELLMASREELVECLHLRLGPAIKVYSAIIQLREYSLKSIRDI